MDFLVWLEGSALSTWVREADTVWAYPTVLTVHTFGLALLVGASALVDIRLLGVATRLPLGPMRPLFSLMWIGFWLNAITGTMLFMADASRRGASLFFLTKLLFVAAGVVTIVLIRRQLYPRGAEPAPITGPLKRLAVVSLVAWAVAISAGRLLAYI